MGIEFVDADRNELHFDRQQAWYIVDFIETMMDAGADSFRIMGDVFPDCLDLTAYKDGVELDHIHPRSEAFLRGNL